MVGADDGDGTATGTARCPPSQREAGLNLPGGPVRLRTRTGSRQRRCLPATFLVEDLGAWPALAALFGLGRLRDRGVLGGHRRRLLLPGLLRVPRRLRLLGLLRLLGVLGLLLLRLLACFALAAFSCTSLSTLVPGLPAGDVTGREPARTGRSGSARRDPPRRGPPRPGRGRRGWAGAVPPGRVGAAGGARARAPCPATGSASRGPAVSPGGGLAPVGSPGRTTTDLGGSTALSAESGATLGAGPGASSEEATKPRPARAPALSSARTTVAAPVVLPVSATARTARCLLMCPEILALSSGPGRPDLELLHRISAGPHCRSVSTLSAGPYR